MPDIPNLNEGLAEQGNDELFEARRFKADPGQSPIRIDKFVTDRMVKVSRSRVQNAIHAGNILVNNEPVKPNYKVVAGDEVVLMVADEPRDFEIIPENIPLEIVFEDDDILIINKQPGLVVHPGVGNYTGTLVHALCYYFQGQRLPIKDGHEHYQPGLVHRIDKDTSGLMVIAKTDMAMQSLSKQFYNHTVKRTYNAIVWGQPDPADGTVTAHVGRDPYDSLKYRTFPEGDYGKHAVTHFKTLEPMYYISLIECRLETGRTHQIRVHMRSIGHPLFNDDRYGGSEVLKGTIFTKYKEFVHNCFKLIPRQSLHAKTLGFVHPRTGEEVFFDSELPNDFKQVMAKWRVYLNARKGQIQQEIADSDVVYDDITT